MKYVVVLGDGMADQPIEELGGKTPLEYAKTPMMDELAKVSEIGMVHTVPDGMSPGSDTANLSVLGYDPKIYYSGRSPLEALSIGVPMKSTDVAIHQLPSSADRGPGHGHAPDPAPRYSGTGHRGQAAEGSRAAGDDGEELRHSGQPSHQR